MFAFIKRIIGDLTGRPADPEVPPVIDWKNLKTNEDFAIALTKLKFSIEKTKDWFKAEIRPQDDFRIIFCHPDFAVSLFRRWRLGTKRKTDGTFAITRFGPFGFSWRPAAF